MVGRSVPVDIWSPKRQQTLAATNKAPQVLDKIKASLEPRKFDKVTGLDDFQAAKTPSDALIHEKLKDKTVADNKVIHDAIQEALQPTAVFTAAQKQINEELEVLKELAEKFPDRCRAQDIAGGLKENAEKTKKAYVAQHNAEREKLVALLDKNDFKEKLKSALALPADKDLDVVKANMLKDLDDKHKKQLDDLEAGTKNSLSALHKESARRLREILFVAELNASGSAEMRKAIAKIAMDNRANATPGAEGAFTAVAYHSSLRTVDIESVRLDQIEFLQLMDSDKKITKKTNEQGKEVWHINLGRKIFNPMYSSFSDREKHDLEMIANRVRASGSEGITMQVKADNPKLAEEKGRKAYAACIAAGFSPEKIKIQLVNQKIEYVHTPPDKEVKEPFQVKGIGAGDGLFRKNQHQYTQLQKKAKEIKAELDPIFNQSEGPGASIESLKTRLAALKSTAPAPAPTTPAPDGIAPPAPRV